ncbi:TonB-dependent siderophore receptor [Rhodobacter maris]|uniref:Outer membrane receptor for ferric coprogen and ferric-rhodotorulic acid n=1 Tax=Rhodobacter maris TaxID=446682 RepID=A0A285SXU5_9RHOB|nr:TonB-dependent siderophore receptor [Rhodobacter maris]SOC11613.1 outer membrane receptor for ferric coprogen and ferric-rhodotorulic acid [Rhodobacter maris]
MTYEGRIRRALVLGTALVAPMLAGGARAEEPMVLDAITVEGASYETEGTKSYKSGLISVGEKAAMSPREVPQSTSVVTRQQIEDGGYTALETAVANVPGLLVLQNDVGRSSLFSRGFEFDYLYYDGLPAPVSSIYGTQPDLSIMDHIEVLKGPSGLFIGQGSPAGAVNMRLKQASRTEPGGYVTATVDSDGQKRLEVDYGGALNESGSLRGRLVAAHAEGDGFVDKQENGVDQLYGALAWDISANTTLTFSASKMSRDIAPYNGLPSYADGSLIWLDAGTTTAADWNRFDNEVTDAVVALEHHFDNGARVKTSLRRSHQTGDFLYAYTGSVAAADNTVSRLSWLSRDFTNDSIAFDAHAELPFMLGGWEGLAILGADAQRAKTTLYATSGAITGSWDLDDWDVSGVAEPTVSYGAPTTTETKSEGLYAQFRLKPVEKLTLLGGARLSWVDVDSVSSAGVSSEVKEDGHLTPFAGVTWDISPATTLYASYTEIFQTQTALDAAGNVLKPLEGQQVELGAKASLANGLDVSAALFRLEQVNRAQSVTGETWSEASGKVRVQGVEIEAAGEIGAHLHLAGGYTWSESEYLNGTTSGNTFSTYTPKHMVKLSLAYDVTEGMFHDWSFGGQLIAMSGFSSVSGGTTIRAPGYGVLDLTAKRALDENTDLRLTVSNVFDKEYYTRVGGTTVFNFRGAPRALTVSLTRRF